MTCGCKHKENDMMKKGYNAKMKSMAGKASPMGKPMKKPMKAKKTGRM